MAVFFPDQQLATETLRPPSPRMPDDSHAALRSCHAPSRADSTENGGNSNRSANGPRAPDGLLGSPNRSRPNRAKPSFSLMPHPSVGGRRETARTPESLA